MEKVDVVGHIEENGTETILLQLEDQQSLGISGLIQYLPVPILGDSNPSSQKSIANRIQHDLSDSTLYWDLPLAELVASTPEHWVDLHFFSQRGLQETHDVLVIARALRSGAPDLEVSEDGRKVRRRSSVPDLCAWDDLVIYVERIPPKVTHLQLEETFRKFGQLDEIILPSSRTNIGRHTGFAFVRYKFKESAANALHQLESQFHPLGRDSDVKAHLQMEKTRGRNATDYRVMNMSRWRALTSGYVRRLEKKKQELDLCKRPQHNADQRAEFERKVVGKFSNAHVQTTSKVLKRVFGMVAPVVFVDLNDKTGSGYVRFKSSHGLRLASILFTREYIVQKHKDDTGSILSAKSRPARTESAEADDVPEYRNITLEIVEGEEEVAYWETISKWQHAKENANKYQRLKSSGPGPATSHMTTELADPDVPDAPMKHVKFQDSDEEESGDEEQQDGMESSETSRDNTVEMAVSTMHAKQGTKRDAAEMSNISTKKHRKY
ncbi:hypothetical protein DFS34DRAFT_674126 [Phlyctochytrium arcticum]|nr:hypothetical protein DFS34DRAFT_674126 [Phlyctochytrium arcticum]